MKMDNKGPLNTNNKQNQPQSHDKHDEQSKKYDKKGFHIQRIHPTDDNKKKGPKF